MTSNELFSHTSFSNFENDSPILSLSSTHVIWQGKRMLHFASHDYLGISQHPDLKKNAIKALLHYGTGLCCGEAKGSFVEYQKQLEDKCAQMLGMSELRFFSSRWTALSLLLSSLHSDQGVCFVDIHCDPLLHQAAKAWSMVITYDSEDLEGLHRVLEKRSTFAGPKLIITESLLSLNGKFCDLDALLNVAKKYDSLVLADDSNAFGLYGAGLGIGAHKDSIDFLLCSTDRGAGAAGAFLASSLKMNILLKMFRFDPREWSLPYSALGAIDTAFDLISSMEGERMQLEQRCHWLRLQLKQLDLSTSSHFFCLPFSDKKKAELLWHQLIQKEILAELIDAGEQHVVRLVINSSHTPEDLSMLVAFFEDHF
jgi:7-keto-8-aminopelargonate synthetase-like enzyme